MSLRAVVVVPARDEEERIGACLDALASQDGIGPGELEVVVVLDACRDGTAHAVDRARERHPGGPAVRVLAGPGTGAGAARRLGLDLGCALLHEAGAAGGLLACTDADSVVAPDWVLAQLAAIEAGAVAIGGAIALADDEAAALPPHVLHRRSEQAAERLRLVRRDDPAAEHHHFAGASIGLTAETYAAIGGLEPHAALEDEAFGRRLAEHGVPIARLGAVRVTTSARLDGRAGRGLARDLRLADWLARRTYDGSSYTLDELLAAKQTTVSVVLPAREVAGTVGRVVSLVVALRDAGLVDEVLVVDAGSVDGTADVARAAGADVVGEDELLPEFGPCRGKGDAMWRGLSATSGELVAYLDTDSEDLDAGFVLGLLGPMLTDPSLALVKGAFARPYAVPGGVALPDEGGRVTELCARPLLNLHAPELAGFAQPLAGEICARRSLLEALEFPVGYGVEIAMLLDALRLESLDALGQVRLGTRQNRHQSLRDLGAMAYAVMAAAHRRLPGGGEVVAGPYVQPGEPAAVVRQVPVAERPSLRSLASREADRPLALAAGD